MTDKEFSKEKSILLKKQEKYKKIIDEKYTKLVKKFLAANCVIEKNKVYEIIDRGGNRIPRGYKRFVMYHLDVLTMFSNNPWIEVSGWWLDENNIPKTWSNFTIYGISNPTIFKLSEDQTHHPHPESKISKVH